LSREKKEIENPEPYYIEDVNEQDDNQDDNTDTDEEN